MPFEPRFEITPRILRQLKAIGQTTGFLNAVRLRPEWIREVRNRTNVQEALAPSLASGRARSLVEIAKGEGVADRYVGHLIPLAFLAPDLIAGILSGTQPVDLTTETLTKRNDLPLAWAEQRALLQFE